MSFPYPKILEILTFQVPQALFFCFSELSCFDVISISVNTAQLKGCILQKLRQVKNSVNLWLLVWEHSVGIFIIYLVSLRLLLTYFHCRSVLQNQQGISETIGKVLFAYSHVHYAAPILLALQFLLWQQVKGSEYKKISIFVADAVNTPCFVNRFSKWDQLRL